MNLNLISFIRSEIRANRVNLSIINEELNDFKRRFPLEKIPFMTINEWVTVGNKYCFINMIENKTNFASGSLGFNRNRLFYQGKNDPQPKIIKSILNEKRFIGKNEDYIFSTYMQDIYDFIKNFDPNNYNSKDFLYGVNIIKTKLIMIYRPECKVSGFTSKDHAAKMAEYLGIPVDKNDDCLGLDIKINNYIFEEDETLKTINPYIMGKIIWRFYASNILVEDNKKFLIEDRKNDELLNEEVEDAKIPIEVESKPLPAPKPILEKGAIKYPRDPSISKLALIKAKYKCECGENHISFIRKSNGKNYTEPHHIIPMSAQGKFDYRLDCLPNIISLCSTCHNKLHYGKDIENDLRKIYDLRKEQLEKAGIKITFEQLLSYYK